MGAHGGLESEFWYRVAPLRLRLRDGVEVYEHVYRGRPWFVLRDPLNERFLRVHETAHGLLRLLDGRRSVEAAWCECNRRAGELAMTQPEVVELIGVLYEQGLVCGDQASSSPGDRTVQARHERDARLRHATSLLAYRIPLFNPDRLLERALPLSRVLFSRGALAAWGLLLAAGAASLVGRGDELAASGRAMLNPDPLHLLAVALVFVGIKVLHELSHGLACKHFARRMGSAGTVHSAGVLLIALLPVPYVDASSSWALPDKRQRAAVALAGIYAELAIAALAALVWTATGPGTIHTAAYHALFLAGASTLLFNGNPLLRFDGYYALSDWIEIPNLGSRSRAYLRYRFERRVLGVREAVDPSHTDCERPWLIGYALAASAYRVVVLFWLLLELAGRAFFLGAALALYGVVTWLALPAVRGVQRLLRAPELQPVRGRAVRLLTGAFAFAALGAFAVPLPDSEIAQGTLEPRRLAHVFVQDEGILRTALPTGTPTSPEAGPLVELDNPALEARLRQARAELALTRVQLRDAQGRDPLRSQLLREDARLLEERRDRLAQRLALLHVRAPFAGTWIAHDLEPWSGAYLTVHHERPLGVVADFSDPLVRVVADQLLGPRLSREVGEGAEVSIRLASLPGRVLRGRVERVVPAGQSDLPNPALGMAAGGWLRTRADEGRGRRSEEPFFEVVVQPLDEDLPARVGERAFVRFELPARPLGVRAWHALRELLQKRVAA